MQQKANICPRTLITGQVASEVAPDLFLDFHLPQRYSVTTVALNRYFIINATQGKSRNSSNEQQIPQANKIHK